MFAVGESKVVHLGLIYQTMNGETSMKQAGALRNILMHVHV